MEITIREANISDMDNIINLWYELQLFLKDTIKGTSDIILPEDLNEKRKHYNIVFTSNKYNVFVMEYNNTLVGFMEVCINNKDFDFSIEDYGYIAYFYVKPNFRELVNISKLYKMGEDWLINNGLKYICSDVDGENSIAMKLQQKYWKLNPFKIRMVKEL